MHLLAGRVPLLAAAALLTGGAALLAAAARRRGRTARHGRIDNKGDLLTALGHRANEIGRVECPDVLDARLLQGVLDLLMAPGRHLLGLLAAALAGLLPTALLALSKGRRRSGHRQGKSREQ